MILIYLFNIDVLLIHFLKLHFLKSANEMLMKKKLDLPTVLGVTGSLSLWTAESSVTSADSPESDCPVPEFRKCADATSRSNSGAMDARLLRTNLWPQLFPQLPVWTESPCLNLEHPLVTAILSSPIYFAAKKRWMKYFLKFYFQCFC